jgi:tetratricopeptide (TPR) repeat protein
VEAIAALGDARCVERSRLTSRLAYVDIFDADGDAQRLARRAVAEAEEAGDPAALMEASYILLYSLAGPEGLEERVRLAVALAESAARGAPRELALIGLCDGGADSIALDDAAGARALRARASEIAGDDPHPGIAWNLRVYDTGLALLEGRFAHAARLSAEALALGRRAAHPFAPGCHRLQEAERAWELGDAASAERLLAPILANERGPGQWFEAMHARIVLALGRTDEARARFETLAAPGFERVPRHIRWSRSMLELSLLCAELGDAARAKQLVELLTPVEHQHATAGVPICYGGPMSRGLARLYETLGQSDEALALFENAHEAAASVGARPARARILVEWGAALRRCGAGRRAAERIEEGARLAEEMGIAGVVAQARALVGRA